MKNIIGLLLLPFAMVIVAGMLILIQIKAVFYKETDNE